MKNPGKVLRLPDERLVICYNRQPFLTTTGKFVFYLVDKKYNHIVENGKTKTLIRAKDDVELTTWKLIGYVD